MRCHGHVRRPSGASCSIAQLVARCGPPAPHWCAGAGDLAEQRGHRGLWARHRHQPARPAAGAGGGAAAGWVWPLQRLACDHGTSCLRLPSAHAQHFSSARPAPCPRLPSCLLCHCPADGRCMLRVGMTNPPFILEHLAEVGAILRDDRVFSYLHVPVRVGGWAAGWELFSWGEEHAMLSACGCPICRPSCLDSGQPPHLLPSLHIRAGPVWQRRGADGHAARVQRRAVPARVRHAAGGGAGAGAGHRHHLR